MKYLFIYLAAVNVLSFILYGVDKRRSIKKKWRIKESTLLITGVIGGAVGAIFGMKVFRHKTQHWYFWAVNIAAFAVHCAILWFLL